MKANPVRWFEIPVSDINRAVQFYETVFNVKLQMEYLGEQVMAWFPLNDGEEGSAGSLLYDPNGPKPSKDGAMIYFSSDDVNIELEKIVKLGGIIEQPKVLVSQENDFGYKAFFIDSEGNRIALCSRN